MSIRLFVKHALDRLMAVILLIALLPLLVLISAAIVIDDGRPVFFRQQRLGKRGAVFRIWKFRTMVRNADQYLNEDGSVRVNRITRIGKVLRRLSLDELPQLLNILVGEMSFVGPRPALVEHRQRYTQEQSRRLEFRPGVTGLAQVSGRNTLKWSQRIQYDLQYIDHYTLWEDLKIIGRTVLIAVLSKGVVVDRNPESVDDLAQPGRPDRR